MAKQVTMRRSSLVHVPVNNEIHAIEEHIMYVDQLTDELRNKMEATSDSDIVNHTSQQHCYEENITNLQCGLTFWQNKIYGIETKLKDILNNRHNTRKSLDTYLNELKQIKQSFLSTESECSATVMLRNKTKKEGKCKEDETTRDATENIESKTEYAFDHSKVDLNDNNSLKIKTNKHNVTVTEQNIDQIKFIKNAVMENSNKGYYTKQEEKEPHTYVNDAEESTSNLQCGSKENLQNKFIEKLNIIATEGDHFLPAPPEPTFESSNVSTVMKDIGTNIDIHSQYVLKLRYSDVATQTSFHEMKIVPNKQYQLPQIKNTQANKSQNTYSNMYNAMAKAKYNKVHYNNVCIDENYVNKPILSHGENIYQAMANNSFHSSHTSSPSKFNRREVSCKKSADHCIVYCQKDLDCLLAPSKTTCFELNSNNYLDIYAENYHPGKERDKCCNVNKDSVQFSKTPFMKNQHKLKPLARKGNIDKKRYRRKRLPFSFCSNESGGTWSTDENSISEKSSAKSLIVIHERFNCTKSDDANMAKKDDIKVTNHKKDSTEGDNYILGESQRNTPINVHIVRRIENISTNAKKLSPIVQKKKVPVKYPISPKYRKPRSYSSAFVRKKRFLLKHGTF